MLVGFFCVFSFKCYSMKHYVMFLNKHLIWFLGLIKYIIFYFLRTHKHGTLKSLHDLLYNYLRICRFNKDVPDKV